MTLRETPEDRIFFFLIKKNVFGEKLKLITVVNLVSGGWVEDP